MLANSLSPAAFGSALMQRKVLQALICGRSDPAIWFGSKRYRDGRCHVVEQQADGQVEGERVAAATGTGKPRAKRKAGDAARSAAAGGEGADGIRLGVLGDYIGFHLRMAQDASFRAFARHTGVPDLKPGRFAAMTVISSNPGITQAELGRAIARDKSSVTPLIQELESRGLVGRRRSSSDRRSISLSLTATGEETLRRLMAHAVEHDRKLDAIVGRQKPEFISLLKKIADDLA
jgi:DNA-binding MarR family transcriptional regulator